jgi:hypothetical protein
VGSIDKYSDLRSFYDRLIEELKLYKEFFNGVWFGYTLVSVAFEMTFEKYIYQHYVNTLLAQKDRDDKTRIYIKIDKDSVLVHYYYVNNAEKEKEDRNWNI